MQLEIDWLALCPRRQQSPIVGRTGQVYGGLDRGKPFLNERQFPNERWTGTAGLGIVS